MPLTVPVSDFAFSSHPAPGVDTLNNSFTMPRVGKVHTPTVLKGDLIHESPPALHCVLPSCRINRSLAVCDANSLNHRRAVICFAVGAVPSSWLLGGQLLPLA